MTKGPLAGPFFIWKCGDQERNLVQQNAPAFWTPEGRPAGAKIGLGRSESILPVSDHCHIGTAPRQVTKVILPGASKDKGPLIGPSYSSMNEKDSSHLDETVSQRPNDSPATSGKTAVRTILGPALGKRRMRYQQSTVQTVPATPFAAGRVGLQ